MALINCKECGNQFSDKAKACNKCGAPLKKTSLLTKLFLIFVVLPVVLVTLIPSETKTSATGGTANTPPVKNSHDAVAELIKFESDWKANDFGTMNIDFTITNGSNRPIKDFSIKCTHFAKSGTMIDSNERQIFEVVQAGETKSYNDFNMGFIHSQTYKSGCQVIDFDFAD